MSALYQQEKQKDLQYFERQNTGDGEATGGHAFKTTPFFSFAVKYAGNRNEQDKVTAPKFQFGEIHLGFVDDGSTGDSSSPTTSSDSPPSKPYAQPGQLSGFGLLGFHIGQHPSIDVSEPIILNTRSPNSTFLCAVPQNQSLASHSTTTTTTPKVEPKSRSLCSRGVEVNALVSSSNFYALNEKYQAIACKAGGKIKVDRLLLRDEHLSIPRMHNLMNITDNADTGISLYVSVIHQILQQMTINGEAITLAAFERQLSLVDFAPGQRAMLDMRLRLLSSLMHSKAAPRHRSQTNMFNIGPGTLTIIDLSDPFIDFSMVCALFGICLSIYLKASKTDGGLVVALDEAHKYLNETSGAAAFTEQIITTIRI